MTRAEADDGFTLLEALVALVILTGAVSGVMMLIASNRTLQARGERELRQAMAAEAVLNRIGLDIPLQIGAIIGMSEGGGSWSVTVAPFTDEHEPVKPRPRPLYEVTVRVPAEQAERGTVLRSLKRGPA